MFGFFRKQAPPPAAPAGPPLVVVVDDEEDICEMIAVGLRAAGYEVAVAHDGEEGLELIRSRRPALLVLDIKMPRMNGYEVLTHLQQDPALASLPVFVITSLTSDDIPGETASMSDEEWARRLGVRRFFSKPFPAETIADAAREEIPLAAGGAG